MNWGGDWVLSDEVALSKLDCVHCTTFGGVMTPPVTVEDPPIAFSPFSLSDCTMLDHFSFNDFIAVAFPDLAGDLDIQI